MDAYLCPATISGRRGLKLSQIKPQEAYSDAAIRTNNAILEFCRTSFSGLSGATAGVLGLTALYGFIFYFVASLFMSLLLILKAGSSWGRYFKSRWRIFTSGLMGGLFTYVLSWTFVYGMVHVY